MNIENNKLKYNISDNKFNLNPKDIQLSYDLIKDLFTYILLDNLFIIFKSIENILYLIYSNENKSIISYNLINNKIVNEIKNAHNEFISNFRYYLDKINKRDLILSISAYDNNIKLWNFNNWECLLNIQKINKKGYLYSACFLNDNNQHYIISSNSNFDNTESIKVFDFKGNKIKEINSSKFITYFIDSYYDNKLSESYIITGNYGYVKSYDFKKNKLYHKYDDNDSEVHLSIIINDKIGIIKLIESSYDGNIRIWNFHLGTLLNKIKVGYDELYGICLWNNNYLFVGCSDKTIKLIELKNGYILKNLEDNSYIINIRKIIHPKYGECLISQSIRNNLIKIWISKSLPYN